MLKSLFRVSLCGLALVWAFDGRSIATAQAIRRPGIRRYQSMNTEPIVSPYLNLARPGGDPGFNYFTLVQPQVQQQSYQQTQNAQIRGLNQQLQQQAKEGPYGPVNTIRPTGRGASFRSYSHYYPSKGAGGGGGAPARNYPSSSGGSGGMGMGMGMF
ncbi:MAG TPA: hypothetical protein VNH11_26630 [Pirellulales bacterium]|nr:hypothetical protein [Pirellulales bacterium]